MRKDVKFGLTIGAILVVTLVAYVIVLSRGSSSPQRIGLTLPNPSQQSTGTNDSTDSNDSTDTAKADPGVTASPDDSGTTGTGATAPPEAESPTAAPPATQPTVGAPAQANSDWEGALNHGPPIAVTAPERTVTPTIDSSSSSSMARTGITRSSSTPMIDSLPSTQPSAPMMADIPVLNAPASITPSPSDYEYAKRDTGTTAAPDSSRDLSSTPRTHRVASGESPYSISVAVYGSGKYFKKILAANPGIDARHLKIGQLLVIPELTDTDKPASPAASNTSRSGAVNPASGYTVASGDTLESISRKLYGSAGMIDKLYEANRNLIGADENVLKIGWVLKLPETPTQAGAQR